MSYVGNITKILKYISNVHAEFLKGITFFQSNTRVNHPVYHRDQSCGQVNELKDLDCTHVYDDSDEYSRRSYKVRNCYIERQVYDAIFSHYFPSGEQNFSHRAMLMNTGRGDNKFATCFPSTTLDVKIIWSTDNLFPIQLDIYTVSPVKSRYESYTKHLKTYTKKHHNVNIIHELNVNIQNIYKEKVSCHKNVYDIETRIFIESLKEQSFKENKFWQEITSHSIR